MHNPKTDLIWNVSLVCPSDCSICCVDAVQPRKKAGGRVELYRDEHRTPETFELKQGENIFDASAHYLQHKGEELTLAEKLRVLDNLAGNDVRLDLSGGDVLIVRENLELLHTAARRLGRENITLTATGVGLSRVEPGEVAPHIGELNFTYDRSDAYDNPHRPQGYAPGNLKRAAEYHVLGVKTRAECPLTIHNVGLDHLTALFFDLHKRGIEKLLLMRLFNVGRGTSATQDMPTPRQYREAIDHLRMLQARYGKPVIKLQCALRFFDSALGHAENPCDLLHHSLGLRPNGTLLLSPWAINGLGQPLHDSMVLGNLARTPLKELLESEKMKALRGKLDVNFGHCKIHALFNSRRANPIDRLLDTTDPLLTQQLVATA
ncbi:MAG: hypothetical protein NTV51_12575 [Verrucomicrobia bacterium]|nr:hypothetical protein [Verrucomicrobiota bacterium]